VSVGLRALGIAACLFPVLSALQVLSVLVIDPVATPTMVVRAFEDGAWPERRWKDLDELGSVPRAFVSAEDQRFFLHGGFDWDAVCKAADHNRDGGSVRGASTISQQVAKNVFLWQGRTWARKVLEVWYTTLLELFVPKRRILELYVNVAETGPGTFGAEAGALHHFGRSAASLSRDDAARLAGILPNPRARSVGSQSAWDTAAFVARHPAVFPGDRGYELVRDDVARKTPSAGRCLWRVVRPF
jgi:monofunctional biosynthetic peptidoglycan transglycosylase